MLTQWLVKSPAGGLDEDLTSLWWSGATDGVTLRPMRTLLAWTGVAALSVVLGVVLYSTSLRGSQTGYQETTAPITQSPSASASPTIRQPESGMADELAEPVAPQSAVAPAPQTVVVPPPAYTAPAATSDDSRTKREDEGRDDHDDDSDD